MVQEDKERESCKKKPIEEIQFMSDEDIIYDTPPLQLMDFHFISQTQSKQAIACGFQNKDFFLQPKFIPKYTEPQGEEAIELESSQTKSYKQTHNQKQTLNSRGRVRQNLDIKVFNKLVRNAMKKAAKDTKNNTKLKNVIKDISKSQPKKTYSLILLSKCETRISKKIFDAFYALLKELAQKEKLKNSNQSQTDHQRNIIKIIERGLQSIKEYRLENVEQAFDVLFPLKGIKQNDKKKRENAWNELVAIRKGQGLLY